MQTRYHLTEHEKELLEKRLDLQIAKAAEAAAGRAEAEAMIRHADLRLARKKLEERIAELMDAPA